MLLLKVPILGDLVDFIALLMGYIMQFFFSLDRGIFNEILSWFNVEKIYWLGDGNIAKIIIVLVNSWQYVGIAMIVYLAGLQNIPQMYYEAAMLDGGNSWIVFRHVTLPLLIPAISTAVVQNVVGGLKLNDVIISLTKGGPAMATHSISTFISYSYFEMEKAGYASAAGVFLFAFIFILSTINRLLNLLPGTLELLSITPFLLGSMNLGVKLPSFFSCVLLSLLVNVVL